MAETHSALPDRVAVPAPDDIVPVSFLYQVHGFSDGCDAGSPVAADPPICKLDKVPALYSPYPAITRSFVLAVLIAPELTLVLVPVPWFWASMDAVPAVRNHDETNVRANEMDPDVCAT